MRYAGSWTRCERHGAPSRHGRHEPRAHRTAAARGHRAGARAHGRMRLGRGGRCGPVAPPGPARGRPAERDDAPPARADRAGRGRAARSPRDPHRPPRPPGRGHGDPAPAPGRCGRLCQARRTGGRTAMMAAPRIAIATGAGVATPRPVQPAATAGDAMGPAANDGFATRLDAVGTGVADGPVTPAADAGAAAGAAAGEVAPGGAAAAEAAAALAVASPDMPTPQDAAAAIPDLQSLTAEPGAAQARPTAPLPAASLDHKGAATQALRAQLFPDEAGQRAAAHGMPATIAAERAPLQAQSA